MTVKDLEKRVMMLEAELRELKAKFADQQPEAKSWTDLFGQYKDDPAFAEATRLGREWREKQNQQSLASLDREVKKTRQKGAKKRKPTARGTNGRA